VVGAQDKRIVVVDEWRLRRRVNVARREMPAGRSAAAEASRGIDTLFRIWDYAVSRAIRGI
jgi:hypothetical protein